MDTKYLFRFGYCTPDQWRSNESEGWDDEESSSILIVGDSKRSAMEWGLIVAEEGVRRLFIAAKFKAPPSWTASGFSYWVEENEHTVSGILASDDVPIIRVGEFPDYGRWLVG